MATEAGPEPIQELPRRWLVLGASGSGKSTFSYSMAEILGLPVTHLDKNFWNAGWVETDKKTWAKRVSELVAPDRWIIDGNFSGTLDVRLPRTQAAVLLDYPVWQCVTGIYRRKLQYKSDTRPDLPEGCPEQWPDREFLWWVLSYKWRSRPKVLSKLAAAPHVRLYRLRSRGDGRRLLDQLRGDVARTHGSGSHDRPT